MWKKSELSGMLALGWGDQGFNLELQDYKNIIPWDSAYVMSRFPLQLR